MWIGPYGEPELIKHPQTGVSAVRSSWGTSGTYVSGGAWAVGGAQSHLKYTFNWPFLRGHEVAQLDRLIRPGDLLTVLVATAHEINAIPPTMTDLGVLGEGEHQLSYIPAGERWQFSWDGEGTLEVPDNGLVGPGLYNGVGRGEWFTVSRPEIPEEFTQSDAMKYGGDMVLTFGDVTRYRHEKTHGQGNTGMRLVGDLQVTSYSAPSAVDYSAVTFNLIETGAWE